MNNSFVKKITAFIIVFGLLLSVTGCGDKQNNTDVQTKADKNTVEADTEVLSLDGLKTMPKFKCTDVNGKEVSSEIFKDNKLTLVNLWGTWCSPCVAELPDLEKLYEEVKDQGVNVVGVIEDGLKNEKTVSEILQKSNVKYTNIIPDDKFYDDFVSLCSGYPACLLVDSNGKIVTMTTGPETKDEYLKIINEELEKAKNPKTPVSTDDADSTDGAERLTLKEGVDESSEDITTDAGKKELDPILADIKEKAQKYCGKNFYSEINQKVEGTYVGADTIKDYCEGLNFRHEEYKNGKLMLLRIYDNNSDTYYKYDGEKDVLRKITKYSKKHSISSDNFTVFFEIDRTPSGTSKLIDYKGKKVVYSEEKHDGYECCRWFDAEKGILIKMEVKYFNGEQVQGSASCQYTVKPNRKFDKSVFKFDSKHKTAEE